MRKLLTLCAALVAGGVGCASYPVRAMPAIGAADAPERAAVGGLKVGAKAYTEKAEIKAVFNYDLLSKGILPVYLVIENNSVTEAELLRARVQLRTPSGTVCDAIAADAATTGHGRNAVGEAVFLFGIFSYDDANKFNAEMKRDWAEKGLGEVTILAPGRTISRFVYFNVGKEFKIPGSKLTLTFTSGTARPTLSIPFH